MRQAELGHHPEDFPVLVIPATVNNITMVASHVQKLSGMPSPNMVFNAQMNTKGQSTTNATPNTMRGTMYSARNPLSLPMVSLPHTFSFTFPPLRALGI